MNTGHTGGRGWRRGSALLVALIFAMLFACMAVALAVASKSNLAISRNRLDVGQAHNLVEAGLCLVQRETAGLNVTGSDAAALHASLADHFRFAPTTLPPTPKGSRFRPSRSSGRTAAPEPSRSPCRPTAASRMPRRLR